MFAKQKATKIGPKCHFCKRYGHIQRNCIECAQAEKKSDPVEKRNFKHKINKAEVKQVTSAVQMMKSLVCMHVMHFQSVVQNPLETGLWIQELLVTCVQIKPSILH